MKLIRVKTHWVWRSLSREPWSTRAASRISLTRLDPSIHFLLPLILHSGLWGPRAYSNHLRVKCRSHPGLVNLSDKQAPTCLMTVGGSQWTHVDSTQKGARMEPGWNQFGQNLLIHNPMYFRQNGFWEKRPTSRLTYVHRISIPNKWIQIFDFQMATNNDLHFGMTPVLSSLPVTKIRKSRN